MLTDLPRDRVPASQERPGAAAVFRRGRPLPAETRAYVAAVMDYLARTSVPETK